MFSIAETKWAYTYYFGEFCDPDTRDAVLTRARAHFRKEFADKIGVKYYVADPINGEQI